MEEEDVRRANCSECGAENAGKPRPLKTGFGFGEPAELRATVRRYDFECKECGHEWVG